MPYFNSIKVRLKHWSSRDVVVPVRFQFHKGTIKTDVSYTNKFTSSYFNSIKVRLKHHKLQLVNTILGISIP